MTFNIYTLGCKVNTYESNVMSDALKNAGYVEVPIHEKADISIINTCTVTNVADHKSMKIIHHARKVNPKAIIVAVGCMVQNKQEPIDGVSILLGNVHKSKIVDYIEKFIKTEQQQYDIREVNHLPFETMRLNNFSKTRAFVKIQDGCNHFCTYCVIPYTRGNVRSKKREDVLSEVKTLIQNGHKEIVLTGIHTGNYGIEWDHYQFSDLLEELVSLKGLERLRISSIEMNELNESVLKVMKHSNIIVDHLHIPLQSGSDSVLKRMNRKYNKQQFIEKIDQIRQIRPNISITTDVIVGFPGESETEFLETIDTIQKINFSKIHIFPYSKRDQTVAAKLPHHIDPQIKKQRVKKLMDISKQLEINYMNQFVGTKIEFLPEVSREDNRIGHSGNYLLIKAKGNESLPNEKVFVLIEKIEYPYCIAKIV